MHTVLITGCRSGFGHLLATRLLEAGHRVVATDATVDGWQHTLPGPPEQRLVLPLDVRDDDQVRSAVAAALAWGPVDVLVNNAGYAIFGTQEEADLDAVRDLLDVNVLGIARVTRAVLPALRERQGLVVQLSSVAGRTVFPESGFYAATKYALEAMTEALHQETCTFGVRVRLIEPGSFDTQFLPTASLRSPVPPSDSAYAPLRDLWNRRKFEVLEPPQDAAMVAGAIMAELDDPRPFARVPVGPDAERLLALRDALGPDAWSRFSAARNGGRATQLPGEVLPPAQVLEHSADAPELAATRAAAIHGHLLHWNESEEGRRALAHLSR